MSPQRRGGGRSGDRWRAGIGEPALAFAAQGGRIGGFSGLQGYADAGTVGIGGTDAPSSGDILDLTPTLASNQTAPTGQQQSGSGSPEWQGVDPAIKTLLKDYVYPVESGGRYDRVYGDNPDGSPRTLSDYSWHPGTSVPITSGPDVGKTTSAAGAPQFLAKTWDEVAAATGAKDFSPHSQNIGAQYLAETEYRKQTGRDLADDLNSGKRTPADVLPYLSGQWSSLPGGRQPAAAYAGIGGGGGGLSPLRGTATTGVPVTGLQALHSFQPDIGQAILAGIGGMFSGRGIIGGGIIGGLQNIAEQRQQAREEATVEQRGQQLANEAQHWQQQEAEATKHTGILQQQANTAEAYRKSEAERYLVPPGYQRATTGIEPIPGGPADPKVIEAQAEAKGEMWAPVVTPAGTYVLMNKKTGEVRNPGQLSGSPPQTQAPTTPLSQPPTQSQMPTPQSPTSSPKLQLASADGVIPANSILAQKPYDYQHDSPYIEKGMDVPEPMPISNRSVQSIKTDAENYLQTGKLPPASARGQTPLAYQQINYRNAVQNYGNALALSRGVTPDQLAYMWRTAPGLSKFIIGQPGQATVALGVVVSHLDLFQQLSDVWRAANSMPSTENVQALNRIRAMVSREFGSAAATNITVAGQVIGSEVMKAIGVAGAGTKEERDQAGSAFSNIVSPEQGTGAVQTVQKLMGGQLQGKWRQAQAVGMPQEQFKNLIGDRAYDILSNLDKAGGAAATPPPPLPRISTKADYDKLDPGTKFIGDDGKRYTKP